MNNKQNIYLILFLHFIVITFFNFGHPVTPEMMREKGIADLFFGIFFMMMSLGSLLASPLWGKKMDLNGTKRYMSFSLLFYAIGQVIFGFSNIPLIMIIGRFIGGVSASAWIVGVNTSINVLSPNENKARNFGLVMFVMSIASVVGQLLSVSVGSVHWQYSFIAQIIILTVLFFLMLVGLPTYRNTVKREVKNVKFGDAIKVIKEENIMYSLIGIVCFVVVINLSKSGPSYYISDKVSDLAIMMNSDSLQQLATASVGYINAVVSLSMMFFTLVVINIVEKKMTFRKQIKFQYVVSIIGFIIFFSAIVVNYYELLDVDINVMLIIILISLIPLSGPVAMNRPLTQKNILEKTNADSGQIIGLINSAGSVGMVIASLSFTLFYGLSPILYFSLFAIALTLGLVVYMVASKREYNGK